MAETTLQRAVKAIDRSDEAKLALKARDAKLQYQFVQDQTQLIKASAQSAFESNMRALGWGDEAIQTAQIRNQSSAGTVGLDDDIRLLEPSILDKLDDGVTPRYSGPADPAVANRLLIQQTGTTLAKTMETLGGQAEALFKFN
ncbi:hypothetical protein OO012_02165 [Rhodobacteraceae bacterium KMM 6894]|nr:hypothetical protein [Rhodobacteraceae bacterium KMM 6894]